MWLEMSCCNFKRNLDHSIEMIVADVWRQVICIYPHHLYPTRTGQLRVCPVYKAIYVSSKSRHLLRINIQWNRKEFLLILRRTRRVIENGQWYNFQLRLVAQYCNNEKYQTKFNVPCIVLAKYITSLCKFWLQKISNIHLIFINLKKYFNICVFFSQKYFFKNLSS